MSRRDSPCSDDVNKEDECVPSSSEDSQDGVSSPMENGDEPEFSQKHYDIEPCYYSMTGKSDRNCRGKVYRFREDADLKAFEAHDGTMYRLRDSVFVELSQNEPYVIAAICGFKYTKREHVVVKLTRYFRADDIPELSLNLMKQERAELEIQPHLCPQSLTRELFNSEIQITQPVSCLRGKCIVEYVKEIRHARTVADFSLDNDTFFYCLHYNQDSTKLASTHYAIRVGTSFQAKLPPMAKCAVGDEKDRDELLYRPESIDEETERDYVQLARAFRAYALSGNHMLDSQKNARVSDLLMDEAIIQLHRSGYKVDDALSELNANDIILTTDVDYMTQDDARKFAKGIKQLGKNFSRIHRELLPHHSREQLVSYYYLWKKTPEATKPKQAARRINPTSIKRPTKEKVKVSRPTSTEYLDFDSASESDVENNGPSGRACHHCFGTESKDWHHANGLLLCTECRLHYKKYGQLRHVANRPTQVPECLFKRSNSDEEESGVRTRAGKKEQRRRTPSSMSETPDRRSPNTNSGAPHLTAEDTPTKRLNGSSKRTTAKRPLHNGVMNSMEKASSVEPASPASPPPKLANGLANGHAPGTSTPNGETVSKKMKMEELDDSSDDEPKMTIDEGDDEEPMPVLNGFKKESSVEGSKVDLNGADKQENGVEHEQPTTSQTVNGIESNAESSVASVTVELGAGGENESEVNSENVEDEEPVEPDNKEDTFEVGSNIEFDSKNASFVRSMIRSCGPRCARSDLYFKFKEGSAWDKSMKEKQERKKVAAQNHRNQQEQDAARLLNQQTMLKKEQHAAQQQQAQQHAQLQHMQQQLQAAVLMGQLNGMPQEVLRMMPPQAFGVDPTAAALLMQLMGPQAQQHPNPAMAMQQQIAMHHMEQQQQAHMLRLQHEMQQKMMADQQRSAQQARERENRERLQQQQQALQQQQQQQAAAAAQQLHPQLLHLMNQMGAGQNPPDMARIVEMHNAMQAHAAQQQAQQAQQQREQQERERREREQREREQREREQAAREQAAREQAAREQAAREQAAREQAAAQAAAAAAAQQQQQQQQQQQIPIEQIQQLQMLQMMMNPAFFQQVLQQQQQQTPQQQQQQQQMQQHPTPLQLLQHGMAGQGAPNAAEMMRRLQQADAASIRPPH